MGRREVHSLTSSDLDISGQQDSQNDYCLSVGGSQSYCITSMANKLPKASLTAEKQFAVKYPDLDTQNPSQGKEQKGFSEIGIQRLSSLVDRDIGSADLGAARRQRSG